MNRAVIYARVSTREQEKGFSLGTQVARCEAYAEANGLDVIETVTESYSGAELQRPGLERVRDLADTGAFDTLLVYDLDRLTRSVGHQYLLECEFNSNSVTVAYVLGNYDDSDEGRLQKQIRAAIAEYERAKTRERIMRGRKGKAKAGNVVLGQTGIFGYDVDREGRGAQLVINEDEARIVRLIFRWYIYGDGDGPMAMNAIAERLTELGILTKADRLGRDYKKAGVGEWQAGTVGGMLANTTYYGVWYYNKTKLVTDNGERELVPRPKSQWVAVEVPSIIDKALWDKAQQRRELNKAKRGNKKWRYLLSGRLTCLDCGGKVYGRTVDKRKSRGNPDAVYQYYFCSDCCGASMMVLRDVDNAVWNWVEGLLRNPEGLRHSLERHKAESDKANAPLRERLAMVEDGLESQGEALEKLLDLYLTSDFPKDLLDERKTRIEKIIASLEHEHGRLTRQLQEDTITETQLQTIEDFAKAVNTALDNITFEHKKRLVEVLDVRGIMGVEDGQRIVYVNCDVGNAALSVNKSTHDCNLDATLKC